MSASAIVSGVLFKAPIVKVSKTGNPFATFPIRENVKFVFQTEFINVWNHPVWANPAGGYNSTSQGFIQNTSAPIQSSTFGESSVVQANPGQVGLGARQIEFRANIEF